MSTDEEAPQGCEIKRLLALEGTDSIANWKDIEPIIISVMRVKF